MRVLGIDPGLRFTGYACVEDDREGARLQHAAGLGTLVEAGIIRLRSAVPVADRLVELDTDLREIIERLRPECVAVEKLYAHYKHPTTAIVMGHARGVVLLNVRRRGLGLMELGATEVKKSLTAHGHASKRQMQDGVRVALGLDAAPEPADVADAIAIALTALRRAR